MFVLKSALVAFVAAILLLVVYMEARIALRKSFRPSLTEGLIGSVAIPTGLGLCYLVFTGWAIWMTLFAYPIFVVAGIAVGLVYRTRDAQLRESPRSGAILGKVGTMVLLALVCAGVGAWYALSWPLSVTAIPSRLAPPQTDAGRDDLKRQAEKSLDALATTGLIRGYRYEGEVNVIRIDGSQWKSRPQEYKEAIIREIVRSYASLGYSTQIRIEDYQTNAVYGEFQPPSTVKVY